MQCKKCGPAFVFEKPVTEYTRQMDPAIESTFIAGNRGRGRCMHYRPVEPVQPGSVLYLASQDADVIAFFVYVPLLKIALDGKWDRQFGERHSGKFSGYFGSKGDIPLPSMQKAD
jgi:hypothetical protein